MNYKKIYNDIISNRRENPVSGYVECHHIIPRSLGGDASPDNLVNLTAREHFICHYILTKIYDIGSREYHKMLRAFIMMLFCHSGLQQRYVSSRRYEQLKANYALHVSKHQSGENNNSYGTMWINNVELQTSVKIAKDSQIPEGWEKGRVLNWDKKLKQIAEQDGPSKMDVYLAKRKQQSVDNKKAKAEEYSNLYAVYLQHGFDEFVKITGYEYNRWSLLRAFKKYVPEYTPYEVISTKRKSK